ncbi:MAG: hypothetical protein IBX55_23950, partial [Methyloprofundus sp.]|nr:hypothetical protein [Methyloprofundus sp.]
MKNVWHSNTKTILNWLWAMMMSAVLLAPGLVVANEPTLKQNFRDAEIATVIEAVAKATGKNFI